MIILGIHAGHNAAAALMIDGRIVGMVQEERLTKRKNQTGFPKLAIERLIDAHLDGDVSRIDRVGHSSKYEALFWTALDHYSEFDVSDAVKEMHEYWYPYFYERDSDDEEAIWSDEYWRNKVLSGEGLNKDHNFDLSFIERLNAKEAFDYFNDVERREVFQRHFGWQGDAEFIEHHSCHAHWALWGSDLTPAERADTLVLTADARGDDFNWTVSVVNDAGEIERIAGGLDQIVARVYKFCTLILGMKPNEHEYKVMGLSGYSKSKRHIEAAEAIFHEVLAFRDGEFVNDRPLIDSYFDLKNRLEGQRFDNIAAGLQNWSTKVIVDWASHWLKETGKKNICYSGGLSMNIKSNGDLLNIPGLDKLYVSSSGADESLCGGVCFRMNFEHGNEPVTHVYLGEAPQTGAGWRDHILEDVNADEFDLRDDVDAAAAAKLLANGCTLARCVGPSEFGARALGNRSILADPSKPENLKLINDAIKQRDFWMPFTPSIQAEHADKYLHNPKGIVSPFMTIGFQSREEVRDDMIAALHPGDFSARPQFVRRADNQDYWTLIDEFRKITGIPVLLNTSLNLHGEPMNYSIADAIRTVYLSGLEFLVLPENKLLFKKAAEHKLADILGGNA